jgi:fibronectin type 3 domain-containing protein
MNRSIWLAAAIMALSSNGFCQSNPPTEPKAAQSEQSNMGELNAHEASRVTLPPPKGVKAKQEGDSVVVDWSPSTQKRVVEYKVFRIDEEQGKITEVGRTKGTEFVVAKVEGASAFGVAAVDYRGNESAVSPPVKADKKPAPK